jgi:tyrosyl-tRNA synthetase
MDREMAATPAATASGTATPSADRGELALSDLRGRGMIEQTTDEGALRELLAAPGVSIYVGFDPTAASLHLGHLLPVVVLARLQRFGIRPIALVGGGTGMIGDPSGRGSERTLLAREEIEANSAALREQMAKFLRFEGEGAALMLDNYEWLSGFSHLDWLRDVGKRFTVNYMLAKESVRRRLEDRAGGLSYTEFSYMLLQAYDFLHLYEHFGCRLQGGGSDQWGNITAGTELIRKVHGTEAGGLTFPLLTTAGGEKFGKSAGNAVWLDPRLTSPYRFYQYLYNADDRDAERLLLLFSTLETAEIAEIAAAHRAAPERRQAQRRLAEEVTRRVHGETGLAAALRLSQALFGGELAGLEPHEIDEAFAGVPSVVLARGDLERGLPATAAAAASGAASSRAEARRLLASGGLYLNNVRLTEDRPLGEQDLLAGGVVVFRAGKRSHALARFR